MAWLEGLTAVDLGISFANGKDFAATTDMSEEFTQEVTYQTAFGHDGPVLRRVRKADEGTVTFTAVILKAGAASHMNDETVLQTMRDFDVQVVRGGKTYTYRGCNWRRITIRSGTDQVTLDCDVAIPGYAAP